jgi:glycosyltransferase involved in cell wall biosynthesis
MLEEPQQEQQIPDNGNKKIAEEGRKRTETRKKKILFLCRGDGVYDEMFLKSFEREFDVVSATFNPDPSKDFAASSRKLVVMRGPLSFLYRYPKARYLIYSLGHRQIRSLIRREAPDFVVGSYSTTYGFMAAKTGFHPIVVITFGSDVLLQVRSFLFRRRVRFALTRADVVVSDGPVADKALTGIGIEREKIVSFPRFDPEFVSQLNMGSHGLSARSLRDRFGFGDEKKIVLHTRWFEWVYNVETVVKGFALAKERRKDLVLVLVGDGSLEKKIRSLVRELNLSESIFFAGRLPREELILLYDQADVYVSACVSDSMNASLLEAISRGTPVVVSDSETNRQWVEDGKTGSLFDPSSPTELSGKILNVLQEPQKYREMAMLAKTTIIPKIGWRANRNRLTERLVEMT